MLRLLRAGADMALRKDGKTALQFAKEMGHTECVTAFRKHLEEVAAARREAAAGGAVVVLSSFLVPEDIVD